jgi:hypothetical protein
MEFNGAVSQLFADLKIAKLPKKGKAVPVKGCEGTDGCETL